ncbi:hypothetical protein WN943_029758 [Citrus x changshan-huyou]
MMKSAVADMVNTGGRQGGAIIAVLFLKQYVDERFSGCILTLLVPSGARRCALIQDLVFQRCLRRGMKGEMLRKNLSGVFGLGLDYAFDVSNFSSVA